MIGLDRSHPPAPGPDQPDRGWSLARVFSRWIALATLIPVSIALLAGHIFLNRSIDRELHALVDEELAEAVLHLRSSTDPAIDFHRIAKIFTRDHPSVVMAWRLFRNSDGEVLGEYGDVRALGPDLPSPQAGGITEASNGLLSKTIESEGGLRIGLILDGTQRYESIARYRLIALLVLACCGVLALLVGRFFARRISRLLSQVADSVALSPSPAVAGRPLLDAPRELRAVSDRLHEVLGQLRTQAEETRVFTMSLAHELRSPVQNLVGQAEVALLKPRDPDTYRHILASQIEELSQFSDAIDNVLTLCTGGHGAANRIEQFDLGTEAGLRLSREQNRGLLHDVDVRIRSTGETSILGDREMILRGLRNVVANAVEWSPAGGRVDVHIGGEGDQIRVTVDDQGPGLPEELRASVFQPFVQGPKPKRGRVGYGLGLAMARRAAEAHHGTIRIDSAPGGGARFELAFQRTFTDESGGCAEP